MIPEQTTAPDFTTPGANSDGDSTTQFALSDGVTDGPVILLFYPFDFSPVCADQLCTFRDMEWLTFTEGVDVWGISPDSTHCHKRFISEYNLPFPLLTDRLGEVADQYDLLLEEFENHKHIPKRAIVAIDSNQTIRYTWTPENQYTSPDIEDVEAALSWYRDGGGAA
jgi:peroxiredoxin